MSASDSPYNAYPLRGTQYSFQNWDWNFDDLPASPHHEPAPAPPADDWDFDNWLHNPVDAEDPAFAYTNATPYNMSSSRAQPGRLPNGYVDLTSPHVDLTEPDSPPRRRKRESPTPGPSAKRLKREDGNPAESSNSKSPDAKIEQVDLSQDDDVLDVLKKQREDAIKAQAKPVETVTTFQSFNCVICMDRPTDITATACGHLFCHTCLMEALIAGENRAGPGEAKRSQCPVCRKNISRTRATDVIPLLLKKGLATQPRRKPDAIPATAAPKVQ
ncbi:SUMO-targeted ubiquitin ligase complex subunit slx8 [Didymella keratinophila]|nr:SUMO-targeted ubiquitin ligase complex subunit slx8 [Didymella keratinophila]